MLQRSQAGAGAHGQGYEAGLVSAQALLERGLTLSCDNPPFSQAEELRSQLRLLEDARDGLRRELLEAQRKVREGQDGREAQRQEAGELRRSLGEGAKEREALRRSNEELRGAVKKAESERIRWGDLGDQPGVLHQALSFTLNLTPGSQLFLHCSGEIAQMERVCPQTVSCHLGHFK